MPVTKSGSSPPPRALVKAQAKNSAIAKVKVNRKCKVVSTPEFQPRQLLESLGIPAPSAKAYAALLDARGFDCEAALLMLRSEDLESMGLRTGHQRLLWQYISSKQQAKQRGRALAAQETIAPAMKRPAAVVGQHAQAAHKYAPPAEIAPLLALWLSVEELIRHFSRISHGWGAVATAVLQKRVAEFLTAIWELPQLMCTHWDPALNCCRSPRDMRIFRRAADNDLGMVISVRIQVKPVTSASRKAGTTRLRSSSVCDEPRLLPLMYTGLWPTLNRFLQQTLGLESWKPPTPRTQRDPQDLKLWHAVFLELPFLYAPLVLPSGLHGTSTRGEAVEKRLCIDFHVRQADVDEGG